MTTIKGKTRAGLYCRISEDRVGAGLGVERQREDCARLAKQLGWKAVETYVDNDVSASTGKARENYERMLADVVTGHIGGIVAWHLDRVNRSPAELERLIPILERGDVPIHTVTAGKLDLSTPSGRAMARFYSTIAKMEVDHLGERVRRKKLETALAGGVNSGKQRPYGYAADKVTVIPAEARIVREMMRRFLAGETTLAISKDLNRRGVPATGERPWHPTKLNQMLISPRICGWRQTPATDHPPTAARPATFLAKAQWAGIVSRRDVERAQTMMADETLRPGSSARFLLTGIVRCGGCGRPMTFVHPPGRGPRYTCDTGSPARAAFRCGHISIGQEPLDAHVTASLTAAVAGGLITRVLDLGVALFAADITALRQDELRLDQIGLDHDNGLITRAEWMRRKKHIHTRAAKERQVVRDLPQQAELKRLAKAPTRFTAKWEALTVRERRALLRALTVHISVAPVGSGRRPPTADRVSIEWRA